MTTLKHSDAIVIARAPEDLYDLVSDITRMGAWSPVCKACWWDEGAGPEVGAWFTGRNELPERTWETRSEVVAADRGREFAFIVNGVSVFLLGIAMHCSARQRRAAPSASRRWRLVLVSVRSVRSHADRERSRPQEQAGL